MPEQVSTASKEFAPGWRPNAGDRIAGIITDLGTVEGKYGQYRVITLLVDDTEEQVAVHSFHTVLSRETELAAVGDHLAVAYSGLHETKDGRPFHGYDVQLTKA